MRTKIDIETKTFVRFWLVVIGFIFAIYLAYLARTALTVVLSAAFLALALSGPVNRLRRYIPGKSRVGATAIAFLMVVTSLVAVIFLVMPPIIQQTARFIDGVPDMVDSLAVQWEGIGSFAERYELQNEVENASQSVRENITSWMSSIGGNIISSVGSLFGVIGMFFLTLVLTFLMLVEGPEWLRRLWSLYDDESTMKSHRNIAHRIQRVIAGYVTGQLTVSGIGGLFTGLTVFILSLFFASVPANLAIPAAAIAFTLSLIPMFGATVGGTIITLLLLANNIPAAIIFAVYFIVYQQIENNFISPAIQSKYVELSPLAVLVAVTAGLYLFGLLGGIISIPVAGVIKVFVEEYLSHSKSKRTGGKGSSGRLVSKET